MKNIWRIFSGDMKRLVRNPFALVIAIGLCIIPSLYAWYILKLGSVRKYQKYQDCSSHRGYRLPDG